MSELAGGHYDRALAQLSGVPTSGRSEADQANLTGLALMLKGDPAKAIDSFDAALDLAPNMPAPRLNRAIAWLRTGDYKRALVDLEALANDATSPLRPSATYHQALALDALGRSKDADAMAVRAINLDPSLDDAMLLHGVLQERAGQFQEAGKAFKTYLNHHPESLFAMLRFAVTAQRAGFDQIARNYLHRVIALAPESDEAVEARKFLVMWE